MTEKNPRVPKYHITLVREGSMNVDYAKQISNSSKAAKVFREFFKDVDREQFVVLTLDSKNRIIGLNLVHQGTLTSSLVGMRESMKLAILQNAAGIIHGHNHPSGDSTPSTEDRLTHERLMQVGKLMEIRVLDGIVAGEYTFYSFAENQEFRYE